MLSGFQPLRLYVNKHLLPSHRVLRDNCNFSSVKKYFVWTCSSCSFYVLHWTRQRFSSSGSERPPWTTASIRLHSPSFHRTREEIGSVKKTCHWGHWVDPGLITNTQTAAPLKLSSAVEAREEGKRRKGQSCTIVNSRDNLTSTFRIKPIKYKHWLQAVSNMWLPCTNFSAIAPLALIRPPYRSLIASS